MVARKISPLSNFSPSIRREIHDRTVFSPFKVLWGKVIMIIRLIILRAPVSVFNRLAKYIGPSAFGFFVGPSNPQQSTRMWLGNLNKFVLDKSVVEQYYGKRQMKVFFVFAFGAYVKSLTILFVSASLIGAKMAFFMKHASLAPYQVTGLPQNTFTHAPLTSLKFSRQTS